MWHPLPFAGALTPPASLSLIGLASAEYQFLAVVLPLPVCWLTHIPRANHVLLTWFLSTSKWPKKYGEKIKINGYVVCIYRFSHSGQKKLAAFYCFLAL